MAGGRRTPGPRCCSVAPSNEPWGHSFGGKIRGLCCSPSGRPAKAKNYTTPTETHGTACSGRESHYSLGSAKTIVFKFCSLNEICKSNSLGKDPTAQLWSLISFPAPTLEGKRSLLEWKPSSSRYPEEPEGLLSLDPQVVCYSWITGIEKVAQVVFVRKSLVEVQYLRTTITDEQREEFGRLVESTIRRIESADFLPHSGIRFPQNPCSSCPYVGLCLGKQEMVDAAVVRCPGADSLDWIHELNY